MVKKPTKRTAVPAPQNLTEANKFMVAIGVAKRRIEEANNQMNDQLEKVKESFTQQVEPLQEELVGLVEGLHAYASGHRAELTNSGEHKTIKLPSGTFCWRLTPKAVSITGVVEVIRRLKQLRLHRFIRRKEEIDKEAMLKEEEKAASIEGVEITQREEFVVKPDEATAEITATPGARSLKIR